LEHKINLYVIQEKPKQDNCLQFDETG